MQKGSIKAIQYTGDIGIDMNLIRITASYWKSGE
jgi:hypothetical protein